MNPRRAGPPMLLLALLIGATSAVSACEDKGADTAANQSLPVVAAGRNKLAITGSGSILWNGTPVTEAQLASLLDRSRQMPVEPELQFLPEVDASYDLSARVLQIIKGSGVAKFGFIGNEAYIEEPPAR